MKHSFRYLVVMGLCMLAAMAAAQQPVRGADQNSDLANARALLQAGRDEIIRDEMRLTETEAAAFWPAYERYMADLSMLRDRYAELVVGYLRAYREGSVSEEYAVQLIDEYLDIKSTQLDIRKKHLEHFRKALPARKAARFYQLEDKLEAELDAQLALYVPLMDPV